MAQPTINLSEFLPLVQPHAPGASIPAMSQALRKAAIEFCETTRCWRHVTTVTITEQGNAVAAPDYAAIYEFELATFNEENQLTPVQYSEIETQEFGETGVPRYITQTGPNTVSLLPFSEGDLELSMFLKPRHGDQYDLINDMPENVFDSVPEFMHTLHGEVIAAGALSRLLILPGYPFTDPNMAAFFRQQYDNRAIKSSNHNLRGQHRARPRSRAVWF